jgi:hypothetical protein
VRFCKEAAARSLLSLFGAVIVDEPHHFGAGVQDEALEERQRYEREGIAFRTFNRAFRRVSPEASSVEFVRAAMKSVTGRQALAAWRESQRIQAFPSRSGSRRSAHRRVVKTFVRSGFVRGTPTMVGWMPAV